MNQPFEIIACTSDAEWAEQRRQGIGASEAAAVLGASPWASALSVWARKLGLDDDVVDSEAMEWGSELEPIIANKYQRVTGRALSDLGRYTVLRGIESPWMQCTLDRVIAPVPEHVGPGVLEIKTAGAQFMREWEDTGVPVHYQIQVQHQLAVTGYRWGAVAVLIGGQRFRQIDIERDDDLIERLAQAEEAFWHDYVLAQEPPPPDGTEATRDLLARLYPKPDPEAASVMLPPESVDWDAALVMAKAALKQWKSKEIEASNRIKAAIGNAPAGILPGGVVYAWKTQDRKAHSVPESSPRVLYRKEPKS